MTTSIVSICNLALSGLGKDNIQALTDAGAEARACRQFFDQTLDGLLQVYPWRFAAATQALAEIENDRAGTWGYAYARPNDCLKIRAVRGDGSAEAGHVGLDATSDPSARYDAEGLTIYCSLSPAFLHFTRRIVDPARYSPLFIDALSWHLAVRLAMPLTRDPKVRADAYQLAGLLQGKAEMADAAEVRESYDHPSEMVAVRDGYAETARSGAGVV